MSVQSLKLGLIGAGRIGRLHAHLIASSIPTARLLAVADVSEQSARTCAENYAIPFFSQDYHDVLNNLEIQAVVICSSTDTHARIIEEAANAGKHIFCEKPIALDLLSIDRALQTVERCGVKLQIGFNRRFDADFQRVHQAVQEKEIGQPRLLRIVSYDPAPPPIDYIRVSGGLFLDMSIHDFDMARFLIGDRVEEVFVMAAALDDPAIAEAGDVDTAITMLRFANGVIATIDNSRRAVYGYDQRVEILGSAGAIHTSNRYANTAVISDAHSVRRDLPLNFFLERYSTSYAAEMSSFVDAILHDKPVVVTADDGRIPVVLALAAQKSLKEHRPVRIDEIE